MNRVLLFLLILGFMPLACVENPDVPGVDTFVVHLHIPPSEKNLEFAVDQGRLTALPEDGFGQQFLVSAQAKELIVTRAGVEVERLAFRQTGEGIWFFAGSIVGYATPPPVLPEKPGEVVVYYVPTAGDVDQNWGLHLWNAVSNQSYTSWDSPVPMNRTGTFYGYVAPFAPEGSLPEKLGLIVHDGDLKASNGDILYEPGQKGRIIFLSRNGKIACSPDLAPCGWQAATEGASAHWVTRNEIRWHVDPQAARYVLLSSKDALLDLNKLEGAMTDPQVKQLPLSLNPGAPEAAAPLNGFSALLVNAGDQLADVLKTELLAAAVNDQGRIVSATRVQLGGVLDDAFAYQGELGLHGQELSVWAPTAQELTVQVYNRDLQLVDQLRMQETRGVWSATIPQRWIVQKLYYRLQIRVFHPVSGHIESYETTDPYAISGSLNSTHSQFLDLNDPGLKPSGWDAALPTIRNPTDMVFYEMHIRDFSAHDSSVPAIFRGTYQAFTFNSKGMQHLRSLQQAGLTHVQVLPAYDFGSVNEDASQTLKLTDSFAQLCAFLPAGDARCLDPGSTSIFDVFSSLPRDGDEIARYTSTLKEHDPFNWGYDPVHYGMPEGSYALGRQGESRVLEFRQMAQALQSVGLHLAMDVVYNHSFASGLNNFSVLDKIVPGYYQRLHPISGAIEQSSCCENTASERIMMEKLMIDTLKRWHKDYKVDAFRFDLMGLHFKANMLNIQKALGPDVFLFGEGWAMGELNGDARQQQAATQKNMAGTGIATFNDRLRDAVRGGGPMDCGVRLTQQSPVNGLAFDDNGRGGLLQEKFNGASCTDPTAFEEASAAAKKDALLGIQDQLRLGLAGTLADYPLHTYDGKTVLGRERSGYTASPIETINYIENHDNQTFWDITQLKLPYRLTEEERVRVHALGLAFNMLAIGVPYFEMGAEFLRSKSLVRDSYNAGDWYNYVDFDFQRSNWNRGLPPADKDGDNLAIIRDVVKNRPEGPSAAAMQQSIGMFRDLLALRKSISLFRMNQTQDVVQNIDFIDKTENMPGVIAMRLRGAGTELVVIFNMKPETALIPYTVPMQLHPIQQQGSDTLVKQARADGVQISVPARTAAVFVR